MCGEKVNLNGRRSKEISIIANLLKIAVLGLQLTDLISALSRARERSRQDDANTVDLLDELNIT
ncbi:MAG: multidrug efflux pump subunit AcrB [Flavobacterium sp.]